MAVNINELSRREFIRTIGAGVVTAALSRHLLGAEIIAATGAGGQPKDRPNIMVAIADDWSWPHASCLGDKTVKTPNFDQVAREGVTFNRAYCAAPTCTASRASLLTGQMFYRLQIGAFLWGPLDKKFDVYPDLLEAAGYAVGMASGEPYKGWAPGDYRPGGRTRNPAGPRVTDLDAWLKETPKDKPICYWFGSRNPHRPYKEGEGVEAGLDAKAVAVPAYLPDSPATRGDLCDYYLRVQKFDAQLGELIATLRKHDRLENTILVVTSDNGMSFPRSKTNLYDIGTHMPLLVRWGSRVKGGRTVDDFVSLSDLAPTFLAAAGLSVPADMTGRNLMDAITSGASGQIDAARDFVVTGREAHGSLYPCRALNTRDFLYIRNFRPELSPECCDDGPTKSYVKEKKDDPAVKPFYDRYAAKRPAEELYDNRKDPDQLTNVAADPQYADIKNKLAKQLMDYLAKTGDPRATGKGEVFDKYPNPRPPDPPKTKPAK